MNNYNDLLKKYINNNNNNNNKQIKCCDNMKIIKSYTDENVCLNCGSIAYLATEYEFDITQMNINIYKNVISTMNLGIFYKFGTKSRVQRIQKWNDVSYKIRTILETYKEFDELAHKYNIPKSGIDNAKNYYNKIKNIQEKNTKNKVDKKIKTKNCIFRGKNKIGIKTACIYYGLLSQEQHKSTEDIAKMFNVNKKIVTIGCKKFDDIISENKLIELKNKTCIKQDNVDIDINTMNNIKPIDYIVNYKSKLKIEQKYIDIIINILKKIDEYDLVIDKQPISIAVTAIMLIIDKYKLNVDKKNILKIYNISEITITKIYKELIKHLQKLINS